MKSKDKKALKKRVFEEEDFIYCPRLSNSLNKLIEKNASGVEDERIMKVLLLSEKEFEKHYSSALTKLKKGLEKKE